MAVNPAMFKMLIAEKFGSKAILIKSLFALVAIGNRIPNKVPISRPPTIPPIAPSIDFLGEILGFNLCLPNLQPTNKAHVSTAVFVNQTYRNKFTLSKESLSSINASANIETRVVIEEL
jgi:hypothetical protein